MKTLIIGEVVEGKLSSGALEIIAKSQDLGLDFEVATVGTEAVSYTHLTLPTICSV